MGRKQGKQSITPAEQKILGFLQTNGPLTIRDLYKLIDPEETGAYTTTLKTAQNMVEKGLLIRDTSQRSHIYSAAPAAQQVQTRLVRSLVNNIFGGSISKMLLNVVDPRSISSSELEELEETVRQLKAEQQNETKSK